MIEKDIASREDVQLLVDRFYEKVKSDALLAPIFANVDWPEHLPVLYNFWTSMLLSGGSYQGNPFQKHMALPIRAEHFAKWLALFGQTIAENFSGEKADEAKSRATNIVGVFQFRLGLT